MIERIGRYIKFNHTQKNMPCGHDPIVVYVRDDSVTSATIENRKMFLPAQQKSLASMNQSANLINAIEYFIRIETRAGWVLFIGPTDKPESLVEDMLLLATIKKCGTATREDVRNDRVAEQSPIRLIMITQHPIFIHPVNPNKPEYKITAYSTGNSLFDSAETKNFDINVDSESEANRCVEFLMSLSTKEE